MGFPGIYRHALYIQSLNKVVMKKHQCTICYLIYNPEVGVPDGGIAPGTAFEHLPDVWCCTHCGASKDEFIEIEE